MGTSFLLNASRFAPYVYVPRYNAHGTPEGNGTLIPTGMLGVQCIITCIASFKALFA